MAEGEEVPWWREWQEQNSLQGAWKPAAMLGGVKPNP